MNKKFIVISMIIGSFLGTKVYADVKVAEKHVVILQAALDLVQGSYLFGVQNDLSETQKLKVPMMFPEEMTDFRAEEGITPEDLTLGGDGKVYLEKNFPPGLTLVGVSFIAKARFGEAALTFNPIQEVGELSVMVNSKSKLNVASDVLLPGSDGPMGQQYRTLVSKNPLPAGKSIEVTISGVPQGRYGLWVIGFVVIGVLSILAVIFTLNNRKEVAAALG